MRFKIRDLYIFSLVAGMSMLLYEIVRSTNKEQISRLNEAVITDIKPPPTTTTSRSNWLLFNEAPSVDTRPIKATNASVTTHAPTPVSLPNSKTNADIEIKLQKPRPQSPATPELLPESPAPSQRVDSDSDAERRLVLIVSYQRCGSSFFGGLFDRVPRGLYMYEPLDGLYGAMYGTPPGWNVPSDIMNWPNGSHRVIPDDESRAVSSFLTDLLTCRYDKLPTEFLLHKFWIQFKRYEKNLEPFTQCLASTKLYKAHGDCHKRLGASCPRRFNSNINLQKTCHEHLWNSTSSQSLLGQGAIASKLFDNYSTCMQTHRVRAKACINKLSTVCHNSQIRSAKTVRATMQSVGAMLAQLPNLKIIHLIRDPRAVVLSRKRFDKSGQSLFSRGEVVREAKLFCQNLAHDVMLRRQLEEKYPGTTKEVIYDSFVTDPLKHTEEIYQFINTTLPKAIRDYVIKNTSEKKSTAISSKWQTALSFLEVKQISKHCQKVFDVVDYDWVVS